MDDVVGEFERKFGCAPLDALLDEQKRAKVMEIYALSPDSEGVRRRLDALIIARTSGYLRGECG